MSKKRRYYTKSNDDGRNEERFERARKIELDKEKERAAQELIERAEQKVESLSKQPRFNTEEGYHVFYRSIVDWLKSCEIALPPYSSTSRDRDMRLREVWKVEPHWAAMVYQANLIDSNRAWTMTGGRNTVRTYTNILHNANQGQGWRTYIRQQALSFRATDMCSISELGRDGDSKLVDGRIIKSPLRAIYHTDSARCQLTGRPIQSLDYYPTTGGRQAWQAWDYFRCVSSPSDDEAMMGLGYCATSRAIDLIRLLYGVLMYDQEQLGARMPKGILFLHNVSDRQWTEALQARNNDLDAMNRQYFGGVMVLGSTGINEQGANLVALSQLPGNFTRETFVEQTWAGLAACIGYEMGEFWPQKSGVMGRGNETQVQHRKASSKGSMEFTISWQENFQRELPNNLLFEFEERDDEGDLLAAEVEKAWIENATKLYGTGLQEGQPLLTWQEARTYLVDHRVVSGDLTPMEEDVQATDTDDTELERIADAPQIRRAMLENDEIVRLRFDPQTNRFSERVLWERGARKLYQVKKRQDVLYENSELGFTITNEDVDLAIAQAKERVDRRYGEILEAVVVEE